MRRQATLIAFHGEKPPALAEIIGLCQELLTRKLGSFAAYDLHQVHATIVGLEAAPDRSDVLENLNFKKHRNIGVSMDLAGFCRFLLNGGRVPFAVQMAGFLDRDYPFSSRASRPFNRSFSIQGDKAVVMGWPVRGRPLEETPAGLAVAVQEARLYPSTLDEIRVAAQAFGILHDYHRVPGDVDNDFYFRVGLFKQAIDRTLQAEVEGAVRDLLARHQPVVLDIDRAALSLVSYSDNTLPLETSWLWRVAEAHDFKALYGETERRSG